MSSTENEISEVTNLEKKNKDVKKETLDGVVKKSEPLEVVIEKENTKEVVSASDTSIKSAVEKKNLDEVKTSSLPKYNFFVNFLSKLESFTIIGQFQILVAAYLFLIFIVDRSFLALGLMLWLILSVIAKKASILRLLKKASWNRFKKSYTDKSKSKIIKDEDL